MIKKVKIEKKSKLEQPAVARCSILCTSLQIETVCLRAVLNRKEKAEKQVKKKERKVSFIFMRVCSAVQLSKLHECAPLSSHQVGHHCTAHLSTAWRVRVQGKG
jgi:hypothetical protein